MDEHVTHEELIGRIRNGEMMDLSTPGLAEAAKELIRPMVEGMKGKEIIYYARGPWLIRVDRLRICHRGFYAKTTPLQRIHNGLDLRTPFKFGATWAGLRLIGKGISMFMMSDHFYTDEALVAEIKAVLQRGPKPKEISEIFRRASENG